MSIANSLNDSAKLLRVALDRQNGDIYDVGAIVLARMEADITRVRGLETVAPAYEKRLKAFMKKGEANVQTNN